MAAETDMAVWGEGMKRAAKEYPVMLPVVRTLLKERKRTKPEEQKGRKSSEAVSAAEAQKEFLALAEQVKALAQKLLEEGKTEEADAILSELAAMHV